MKMEVRIIQGPSETNTGGADTVDHKVARLKPTTSPGNLQEGSHLPRRSRNTEFTPNRKTHKGLRSKAFVNGRNDAGIWRSPKLERLRLLNEIVHKARRR